GPRPASHEDRGAARAGPWRVTIDPAAQLRHELRTPLNHIIGYAEMILEDAEDPAVAPLVADLRALHADARHLLSLVNTLLAPARPRPPRPPSWGRRPAAPASPIWARSARR